MGVAPIWKPGDLASYRCLTCGFKWEAHPGPTRCRVCSNIFICWENHPLITEENIKEIVPKEDRI